MATQSLKCFHQEERERKKRKKKRVSGVTALECIPRDDAARLLLACENHPKEKMMLAYLSFPAR